MSQGRSGTSPTKGGSMPQPSYQNPFGSQTYRQPSFGGSTYQQPGQFGGQIFNRQTMPSPGGKGGQSRPPISIQPYPMPSPGGKGGSYQRPPTPYGYGQTTFAPQQFAGYGQPSNIFSFNNPHYQPYIPPTYSQTQTVQSPDVGINPMTPEPKVSAQPINEPIQAPPAPQLQTSVPPEKQTRPDPYPIYDRVGGYNPTMPIGGKGGSGSSSPFIAIDPYGPGGSLEGQPRPTFDDVTPPQMPQGNVESAPPVNLGPEPFDQVIGRGVVGPVSGQISTNMATGDMGSGIGSLFNLQSLMSPRQPTTGSTGFGLGSTFNSQELAQRMQGMVGGPSPMQSPDLIARDRAAYATSNPRLASSAGPANPYAIGGYRNGQINPRFQNMR